MAVNLQREMKRLLIVEESLRDLKAHWFSYIRTIARTATANGLTVDVACNQKAHPEIVNSFRSFPVFKHSVYLSQRKRTLPGERYYSFILHSARTLRVLWPLLRKQQRYDEVFVPTVLVQHLLAWWLVTTFHPNRPRRVTLFFVATPGVWDQQTGKAVMPRSSVLMKMLLRLFKGKLKQGRIRLGVETKAAEQEFRALTGLPFHLFPHPVEFSPITSAPTGGFKFCCYGFARHEKGSDLLAAAIDRITASKKFPEITFRIQWLTPFKMPDGSECGPDQLRGNDRVEIINQALNESEYFDLLKDTDCMLLPYRNSSYHSRLSRVAIEAAILGIPMVYTKGGWLEEIATGFGSGAGMQDGSVDGLVDAIGEIAANLDEFKLKASQRSSDARAYYSGQRFIDTLLQ